MKKRILSLCFLLSLVLAMLPLSLPAAHAEEDQAIEAIEALLVGIPYDTQQAEVADWSDMAVRDAIYSKLLWDDYGNGNHSYLDTASLEYWSDSDGYQHFDMDQIQRITMDILGRDYPLTADSKYIYVSGDELVIMPAHGKLTTLYLQTVTAHAGKIIVVGTAVDTALYSEFAGYFMAVLEENPDSIYGYTLCSIEKISGNQYFGLMGASASSELQQATIGCEAENVLDGDMSTAWVEGVSGVGVNQWIKLENLNGAALELSAIQFTMGYHKTPELLEKNGWPHRIRIECEGGFSQDVELYEYIDVVNLEQPVKTSWVKITILGANKGTKFDDTCITEIQLLGLDSETIFQDYIAKHPTLEYIIGDGVIIDGNMGESDIQTIIVNPGSSQGGTLLNPTLGQQNGSRAADNLTTIVLVVVAAMAVAIVVAIIVLMLGKKKKR